MLRYYIILLLAILCEVVATTALARSASLTKWAPSLIAILGYALAFYLLTFPMRVMPTGVVYALWSGMGIVLISAIGWLWARESLDLPALLGMALILAGVITINVFSKSVGH